MEDTKSIAKIYMEPGGNITVATGRVIKENGRYVTIIFRDNSENIIYKDVLDVPYREEYSHTFMLYSYDERVYTLIDKLAHFIRVYTFNRIKELEDLLSASNNTLKLLGERGK